MAGKSFTGLIISLLILIIVLSAFQKKHQPDPQKKWITGYLASWQHNAGTPYSNWGILTTNDIEWDAITHLIYFALNISTDGTPGLSMDPAKRMNFNADRLKAIVPAAHAHNTKILFSVGGAGNYKGFSSAIRENHRMQFIHTIENIMITYGFDGVDLDMEPIRPVDYENYRTFVRLLRTRLEDVHTFNGEPPLITVAALKGIEISALYADVQDQVDQINIMTYDMAQPWEGWQAWHNSALFSKGVNFESNGKQMSSIQQKVEIALTAGIQRNKLGIGIDFYGYIWHTVHLLGKWSSWPDQDFAIFERNGGVPYSELNQRYNLQEASWDTVAHASYLDVNNPKTFISFDNARSIEQKVQYAKDNGLGGVMIWEIGGGYLKENPAYQKNPLLKALQISMKQNQAGK